MTNSPEASAVASATVLPSSRNSTLAFGAARPAMTASPVGSTLTASKAGLSGETVASFAASPPGADTPAAGAAGSTAGAAGGTLGRPSVRARWPGPAAREGSATGMRDGSSRARRPPRLRPQQSTPQLLRPKPIDFATACSLALASAYTAKAITATNDCHSSFISAIRTGTPEPSRKSPSADARRAQRSARRLPCTIPGRNRIR